MHEKQKNCLGPTFRVREEKSHEAKSLRSQLSFSASDLGIGKLEILAVAMLERYCLKNVKNSISMLRFDLVTS